MRDPKEPTLPASPASAFTLGDLREPSLEERFAELGRAVVLASYPTPIEAELVKSRLEADGIAADLVDVHTVSIGGPLALAVGGVKVRVLEEDEERARDVIAGIGTVALLDAPEDDDDDDLALAEQAARKTPDALASRALTAGVLGAVLVPPLALYSLWLVWGLSRDERALSRRGRVKTALALGFDALTSLWLLPFL